MSRVVKFEGARPPVKFPVRGQKWRTAEQWQRALRRLDVVSIEDVRDDVMSIIKNSGLSYAEVHARGGPTPGTLSKWASHEVKRPQNASLRSALRACGKDFYIGEKIR